jgi:arsenate reductase-like glutaredoxin family protein
MNIQIFGSNKCFDTKKAIRYFKERRIKFQLIDILDKGVSKGEYNSIAKAVGGIDYLINEKSKDAHMLSHVLKSHKEDLLLENQGLFHTPLVRNGKQATVGYKPDVWKNWE